MVSALLSSSQIARGDETDAASRQLLEEGARRLKDGDYDEAIARFQEAHTRTGAPGLLYNIAQAHRLKGACGPAAASYRDYLATGPTGKARERAEARLAEMEACEAKQASTGVAPGASAGGETPPAAVPAPEQLRAMPPSPPGTELQPLTARADRGKAPNHRRTATIAAGAAAALAAGAGSYFAWEAGQASQRSSEVFRGGGQWDERAAEIERTGIRDERLAIASFTGAVISAGIAVWLLLRN